MRKRNYALVALFFIVSLTGMPAGCSKNQNIVFSEEEEKQFQEIDLTFFGFKYEALNVMAIEEALHGYMDEYPGISIAYDGIKSPEYFEVLEKRLSTGHGNDIFMTDHERVLKLASQGILADLSELSTLENFSDLANSQIYAGETIDYLPTSISAFGLYCNIDLLEEHGQKIPENFAELEAVCNYFVSEGITPIVANNDISLKTVVIAKGLFSVYQGENTEREIEQFNSGQADLAKALQPGFELVEQMLELGWVNASEALSTAKTKDDLVLFAQGARPFLLTGAWATPRLRELKPEFVFEVRPYPIMEDGSVLVINVDTRLSVNANSPYVEEAKRFVEYLTQKDVMWKFVNSQCSFSPLKENRLAQDKAIQSIGPYLTNGRSLFGADDRLHLPIWELTRQCIVGMLEGGDAQNAVSQMRQQIKEWRNKKTEG